MNLDTASCYQALLTHDTRFDGAFFVGVSTTRIYCRTVCTAKTPRPDRCTFYPSAAAAEAAGYRPCLRCRPEVAPGRAQIDAGIGDWTAQYVATRALARPDAFPHTDLGIRTALGEKNPKRILEMADRWRPWRAYAAMHLWKSLPGKSVGEK